MARIIFATKAARKMHHELAHIYSKPTAQAFDDFLTMSICALSGGQMEAEYMETIKPYTKHELGLFVRSFGHLLQGMHSEGEDILGDYFTGAVTFGQHGQFFTPQPLCELMSAITFPRRKGNVMDPCCGSGRLLLSAAKRNPAGTFYGQDIDLRCVKMAALNLGLHGYHSFISWGDSLSCEQKQTYETRHPALTGKWAIREI